MDSHEAPQRAGANFRANMKALRAVKAINQSQLAKLLTDATGKTWHQQTIARIEDDENPRAVKIDEVVEIASALGSTLSIMTQAATWADINDARSKLGLIRSRIEQECEAYRNLQFELAQYVDDAAASDANFTDAELGLASEVAGTLTMVLQRYEEFSNMGLHELAKLDEPNSFFGSASPQLARQMTKRQAGLYVRIFQAARNLAKEESAIEKAVVSELVRFRGPGVDALPDSLQTLFDSVRSRSQLPDA